MFRKSRRRGWGSGWTNGSQGGEKIVSGPCELERCPKHDHGLQSPDLSSATETATVLLPGRGQLLETKWLLSTKKHTDQRGPVH